MNLLNNSKTDDVPLFPQEFKFVRSLCFVEPSRVIKNEDDKPSVFFVNKHQAIELMKARYGFLNKTEVKEELHGINRELR